MESHTRTTTPLKYRNKAGKWTLHVHHNPARKWGLFRIEQLGSLLDTLTVPNGTAWLYLDSHAWWMPHKKSKSSLSNATLGSVTVELAKPRMTKSARMAELNLDTARIPEQPSITVPGTVNKIIVSPRPSRPEEMQIAVDGNDDQHRDLRIENSLIDEHGDDVKLKKGAHVDITVATKKSRK